MAPRMTIRDLGYRPGFLPTGPKNSILDIEGVHVGQVTIGQDGDDVCAGITVILPRHPDDISIPCYAGMHVVNGNGEVTGSYQIKDWGFTNTPIALTNSRSLGTAFAGIWDWTFDRARSKGISDEEMGHNYGTPVVGETADWWLNNAHASSLPPSIVQEALGAALTQTEVLEGQNGGGAGMTCHQFPGGTGTSSRVVTGSSKEEYTVGVLVQSNYGHTHDFQIGGVPIGKLILKEIGSPVHVEDDGKNEEGAETDTTTPTTSGKADDGSIVIIVITNAPLLPHQLNRLALHASIGLSQVGGHGIGRNFSGDIIIALSTFNKPNERVLTPPIRGVGPVETNTVQIIKNESIDAVNRAASEAAEEAILNSLVAGRDGRRGFGGLRLDGLPVERVREWLGRYRVDV